MMKPAPMLAAALLAGMAFASAHAAEGVATLRVERGNVMTSTGGEFVTARSGAQLVEGERLMLTDGASASVVYDNQCSEPYTAAGVFVVDAVCNSMGAVETATGAVATAAVGPAGIGSSGLIAAGSIAAGVAVGAAILDNMEEVPAPAISR